MESILYGVGLLYLLLCEGDLLLHLLCDLLSLQGDSLLSELKDLLLGLGLWLDLLFL